MSQKPLTDEACREAVRVLLEEGTHTAAAERLGITRGTFDNRLRVYKMRFGKVDVAAKPAPEVAKATAVRLRDAEAELARERRINKLLGKFNGNTLKPPKWAAPVKSKTVDRAIATAFLSDCHFDEVVKPEEIGHVNAYNRQIAEMRLERFFANVTKLMGHYISGIKMDGLVLPLGGDMVSGNIHEELEISNEDAIISTCFHWAEQIAAGIAILKKLGVPIHVPCVVGNHGRVRQRLRYKGRVKDNFDWLIYRLLAMHFAGDSQVSFAVSDDTEARWNCYETRVHMSHGDQFSGGSGIAGIATPLALGDHRKRKVMQATNRPYDILMIGHFHQLKDMGGLIVNGSLKGYDEYAAGHNFGFEPPQQAFYLVDPKHGKTIFAPVHVASDSEPWKSAPRNDAHWMRAA